MASSSSASLGLGMSLGIESTSHGDQAFSSGHPGLRQCDAMGNAINPRLRSLTAPSLYSSYVSVLYTLHAVLNLMDNRTPRRS